jgi:hypothetical protein
VVICQKKVWGQIMRRSRAITSTASCTFRLYYVKLEGVYYDYIKIEILMTLYHPLTASLLRTATYHTVLHTLATTQN